MKVGGLSVLVGESCLTNEFMQCDDKGPCHRCEKQGQGTLCVRVHFVDLDVFSKCKSLRRAGGTELD